MDHAIALAKAGAIPEARAALISYLHIHEDDPQAWLWLACITENPWETVSCLRKAGELEPRCSGVPEGIAWAEEHIAAGRSVEPMSGPFVPALDAPADAPPREALSPAPTSRRPKWVASALLALILVVGLGAILWFALFDNDIPALGAASLVSPPAPAGTPTAPSPSSWEVAWEQGNWEAVVTLLKLQVEKRPEDAALRNRLFDAYVQLGNQVAANGRLDTALEHYEAAMALRPYDSELQQARGLAARYVSGMDRFQAGEWDAAATIFTDIYAENSAYRETRDLLYSSHYNLGVAHQAAGRLDAAKREYALALQYTENSMEIENKLLQIDRIENPPTPTPSFKRIEVVISEQRFYAYEGDQLIHKFICSTGSNASPTAPGSYRVLDKIPMAYASTWNLQMPYWLGIYWSGTLENGIHALPILSNGRLLWDGYLGQRVSFGCVILSTEAAKIIYEWADVGTPVIIRP